MKYLLAVGLGLLSLGCPARSLFPLFAEKDLISLPAIVGIWVNGKGETFTFQKTTDKNYEVVFRDQEGNTGLLKAQIGMLGKSWFLDSYPNQNNPDYYMMRTHLISKISLDGDSLQISSLESDWLKQMIESGQLKISHVELNADILLTASTEELQDIVLRYADDKGAFPKPDKLGRMK